jgi:hypothetical protein
MVAAKEMRCFKSTLLKQQTTVVEVYTCDIVTKIYHRLTIGKLFLRRLVCFSSEIPLTGGKL